MRRIVSFFFLITLITSLAGAAEIHGTWSALVDGDRVQLSIHRDDSNWSRTLPRSDFSLTDAQIDSPSEAPVHFTLARDAGTTDFNGTFQRNEGVGRFTFTPNSGFPSTLRSLGVSSDEPIDDERLFSLAMLDVSLGFIRDMQSLGYREDLERYVAFRIHGVTPKFVRDLRALGYDKLEADDLVRFRIHGVTPEFIRGLKDLGYTLSSDDLVRFRIHGVTPEFVGELKQLGYAHIAADDLVRMRIHGVTPQFIRELAGAGYHGIPVEKLIQMRIRGVDAVLLQHAQ